MLFLGNGSGEEEQMISMFPNLLAGFPLDLRTSDYSFPQTLLVTQRPPTSELETKCQPSCERNDPSQPCLGWGVVRSCQSKMVLDAE